jgi:hypothetical protein
MYKKLLMGCIATLVLGVGTGSLVMGSSVKPEVKGIAITPTVTPTDAPSPTATPSATPTPTVRIWPTVTPTPSPTLAPTAPQASNQDVKKDLNEYMACKNACPRIEGKTERVCDTPNPDGGATTGHSCRVTVEGSAPDQACIDSCKSKYGLDF